MISKSFDEYVEWRKSIFDPKGDCDPVAFDPSPVHLLRAARVIGQTEQVEPLGPGTFVKAYSFETPEGWFVLKVPVAERFAPALEIAAFVAQQAVDVGTPTVVPLLTDTSHYVAPFTFQIEPFVEEEAGPNPQWSWNEIQPLGYGPLDPRDPTKALFNTWSGYLNTRLIEQIEICLDIGAIDPHDAARVKDLMATVEEPLNSGLIHNDLSPRNVIGTHIIDWESCISGDPLYELASWYAFHTELLKTAKLTDRTFWLYYLRVVIARTVHRHRFQIPEHPVYQPSSRRIQLALSRL